MSSRLLPRRKGHRFKPLASYVASPGVHVDDGETTWADIRRVTSRPPPTGPILAVQMKKEK